MSVFHCRPFLSAANFNKPFQGFSQAILHRIISGGLFFLFEDLFRAPCRTVWGNTLTGNFMVGMAAGSVNGLLLNPVALCKFRMWGKDCTVLDEMKAMWRAKGWRPFVVGGLSTVMRDGLFGIIYTTTKYALGAPVGMGPRGPPTPGAPSSSSSSPATGRTFSGQFVSKSIAAGLGTICSAPLNYVRSLKYAHLCLETHPPSMFAILAGLYADTAAISKKKGRWAAAQFIQMRWNLGWGTTRVAVGMAFGDFVYHNCKRLF
eukprot:NODE_218_length_1630_cov_130.833650_g152_i0.p1 GENE.NODE_218_length_1630_cov_130.833650_g152_i0~~NODE_218_length_1630_cov_130.833650_g152_i0.p1  ORF type:complete len:261 (-),score=44.10 NODE_218_length_1630_cov_130.833650_g152_i0:715-1497(-)